MYDKFIVRTNPSMGPRQVLTTGVIVFLAYFDKYPSFRKRLNASEHVDVNVDFIRIHLNRKPINDEIGYNQR